jgi:hypothetical protein
MPLRIKSLKHDCAFGDTACLRTPDLSVHLVPLRAIKQGH